MPTFPRSRRRREATEMFYVDENGKKQDADLHNPILDEGDHEAALAVSNAVRARLGIPPAE